MSTKNKKQEATMNIEQTLNPFAVTEETVTLTATIPRHAKVDLLKALGVSVTRDLATLIDHPNALKHILAYGVGRFNRDGASPEEWLSIDGTEFADGPVNVGADGVTHPEPLNRKATDAERGAEAIRLSDEKWTRLLAGTLRERIGGTSVDPLVAECRTLTVIALVKRGVARKAIPKLPALEDMRRELARFEGLFDRIHARAEKVVAARAGEDDL